MTRVQGQAEGPTRPSLGVAGYAHALVGRSLILALAWWALTEGRADGWPIGAPAIALAVLASLWLQSPGRLRLSLIGLVRFLGFFLSQSIRGGLQVATLALRPRPELEPGWLDVPVRLPPGPARVLLTYTLSLMPGTLSVRLDQDTLRLHLLDLRQPVAEEVRVTETHIARMLRLPT